MMFSWFLLLTALLPFRPQNSPNTPAPQAPPSEAQQPVQVTVRPYCPIRLGGVYTLGLGEGSDSLEESAKKGSKLSTINQEWITKNCDVIGLNSLNITSETYPAMVKAEKLFTPLLYVSASSLSENPTAQGNVGGWKPEMQAWTLKDAEGKEIAHPDAGGHWMDFGNTDWATHWRNQVLGMVQKYQAQGVVAAELPPGNTFVGDKLANYKTSFDRIEATTQWLRAARAEGRYLMVPSALGFDLVVGHATQPTSATIEQPALSGRAWDHFYPLMDGAWGEGWVFPYWATDPLPEKLWEMHLEAADRAGRDGQVFIAATAYRNDTELEFALASYLLVVHKQGRSVFQPMPLKSGRRPDAGYSLAVLREEVAAKSSYFNVLLGSPIQERHPVRVQQGTVWRRAFMYGAVYVNSSDTHTAIVGLGGKMRRCDGKMVQKVTLPPHTGVIFQLPRSTK